MEPNPSPSRAPRASAISHCHVPIARCRGRRCCVEGCSACMSSCVAADTVLCDALLACRRVWPPILQCVSRVVIPQCLSRVGGLSDGLYEDAEARISLVLEVSQHHLASARISESTCNILASFARSSESLRASMCVCALHEVRRRFSGRPVRLRSDSPELEVAIFHRMLAFACAVH